ncbi:MAG: transcriptional repressor [Anaerolineae bacterium]|nr:transcriptional repressor [Anaerolineae bacterium]
MAEMTTVLEKIRDQGERMTMPRRLVIEALGQSHKHRTIADIHLYMQAHYPDYGISDTTIYRVLQWLKDLELISQTDIGQAGVVYALIDHPCHHHLICLSCGETFTVDDAPFATLRDQLQQNYGFEARIEHMAVYGHCRKCVESGKTK